MQPLTEDLSGTVDKLVRPSESILSTTPSTVVIGQLIARTEALERALHEVSQAIQQLAGNGAALRSRD